MGIVRNAMALLGHRTEASSVPFSSLPLCKVVEGVEDNGISPRSNGLVSSVIEKWLTAVYPAKHGKIVRAQVHDLLRKALVFQSTIEKKSIIDNVVTEPVPEVVGPVLMIKVDIEGACCCACNGQHCMGLNLL